MEPTALVRSVPDSFVDALVMGERPFIDVPRAREQHRRYRAVLEAAGYSVTVIDADEAHPDCAFIEDVAIALDSFAIMTRPGAPERRGESPAVATALGSLLPIRRIAEPGTIDGGDVLRMGTMVFVGRSSRTNDSGIRQVSEFAADDGLRVVAVRVAKVLHLKSAVVALDDESVLVAPGRVDTASFSAYRMIETAPGEGHLASVLKLRDGHLAVTTTSPQTAARLEDAGYEWLPVDASEFQAADGGLTCLSILLEGTSG